MAKNFRTLAATASFIFAAAALAPANALLAEASTKELMKARHDHYHRLGDAFKEVRDESRGGSQAWDALNRAAKVINEAAANQAKWFPAGTGPEAGKTRALPEIWARPKEFEAAQQVFSDAAPGLLAAVNAKDLPAVKTQFGAVGKACKNCHDAFRSPEEHD
ncbi:MAG: c-type cytochrome [Steroidobacter sp.]